MLAKAGRAIAGPCGAFSASAQPIFFTESICGLRPYRTRPRTKIVHWAKAAARDARHSAARVARPMAALRNREGGAAVSNAAPRRPLNQNVRNESAFAPLMGS